MLAYEVARGGFLDVHVRRLREVYKDRRDIMLEAMQEHFPADVLLDKAPRVGSSSG